MPYVGGNPVASPSTANANWGAITDAEATGWTVNLKNGEWIPVVDTTRANVLNNIAESQAARASSNFGQFVKNEGLLQENLGIWPPNSGGYWPQNVTLNPGVLIDRYGYANGRFVSPLGISFEARALPSSYLAEKPYFQYEVLQPIPDVTQAKVLPWFGQLGKGTQFKLPQSIQWYLDNGYLREVSK
jgi:filamentous hemagglutinin